MQVFLSYPSEHLESAREIRDFIRSVGVDCWFDKDNLVAGDDRNRVRREALRAADLFVLLCSSQTLDRDGVYHREISEALEAAQDKRLGSIYIIPIRLERINLPSEISRYQYIDYPDKEWKTQLAKSLLRTTKHRKQNPDPRLETAAEDRNGTVSRSFSFSEELPNASIDATWYEYSEAEQYWKFVNSVIISRAWGSIYEGRRHIHDWHTNFSNEKENYSSWDIHISEIYRKKKIVSIGVGHGYYMGGAAYPNNLFSTINILGDQYGLLKVKDLFGHSDDVFRNLIRSIDLDLERQSIAGSDERDVGRYADIMGWDLLEAISIRDAGIEFAFSSAVGLPHVLGVFDVTLSWPSIVPILEPEALRSLVDAGVINRP
jgi:TIR domain